VKSSHMCNDLQKRRSLMEFIILLLALLAFSVMTLRWGADSTDGIGSPEWKRREERGSSL
jgi:hypothetical protein